MTRTATARKPRAAAPVATKSRPDPVALLLPQLAKGERYRGVAFDDKGAPSHHLILVAVSSKAMTHDEAQKWAESVGGELAEKNEGWLLVAANADGAVDKAKGPYWLKPQFAGDPEVAWNQYFRNGAQNGWHESSKLRGVAVRRVPIR